MWRKYLAYLILFIFVLLAFLGSFCAITKKKIKFSIYEQNPLITVLVTSYNYEKFINETLDSILAQTYKNYEVVIVDDGSTDNSVEIIKNYVKKHKNFHLYQHNGGINKGLPTSFKLGVEKSSGEYIAVLESDDFWAPNNLLEKIKMINKYPDAAIISNNIVPFGESFEDVSKAITYVNLVNNAFKEKNIISDSNNLFNPIPTFSAVMIKKDILQRVDFDTPIPAFLDLYLYKQILAKHPLYYIHEPLTHWRRHAQSFNSTSKHADNYAKANLFLQKVNDIIAKQKDI